MSYLFNLSEPLVIPRKKISTFVETGLCIALFMDLLGHVVRKTGLLDSRRPFSLFIGEGYPALSPCHPNQ